MWPKRRPGHILEQWTIWNIDNLMSELSITISQENIKAKDDCVDNKNETVFQRASHAVPLPSKGWKITLENNLAKGSEMTLIKILCIIITAFDIAETLDIQTFRSQNIDIISGYRSTKTILSQYAGLSRLDCMSLCMLTENCAGINFHTGDQSQCQLMGEGCGQDTANDWEFAPKVPGKQHIV